MTKAVCIIQARMNSTRMPKKVMYEINHIPILGHCINRIKKANLIDQIVLATTSLKEDDSIVNYTKKLGGVLVFRGDVNDVLGRFSKCSEKFKADTIIRTTADNPLVDPEIIDRAISLYKENNVDYCSNKIKPSFPMGLDVEVFSSRVLKIINKETTDMYDREHVTPPILKQHERFKLLNFTADEDNSDLRVTLDYPSDFHMIEKIFSNFGYENDFNCDQIVSFLRNNPDLVKYDEIIMSEFKKKRKEFR